MFVKPSCSFILRLNNLASHGSLLNAIHKELPIKQCTLYDYKKKFCLIKPKSPNFEQVNKTLEKLQYLWCDPYTKGYNILCPKPINGPKSKKYFSKTIKDDRSNFALHQKLLNCRTPDEEIWQIFESRKLSNHEKAVRDIFLSSLQSLLENCRPGTTVLPFGSHVNGLGSQNGDLDISIIPGPEGKLLTSQPVGLHNMNSRHRLSFLKKINNIMERADPALSGFLIPARIMIINFEHSWLGIQGDISLHNSGTDVALFLEKISHMCPLLPPLAILSKTLFMPIFRTKTVVPNWTSFKFLALLMHFMQIKKLIPPLQQVVEKASLEPFESYTQDNQQIINDGKMTELFLQFLEYLIAFDVDLEKNTFPWEISLSDACLLDCNPPKKVLQCRTIEWLFDSSSIRSITHSIDAKAWSELLTATQQLKEKICCANEFGFTKFFAKEPFIAQQIQHPPRRFRRI